MNPSRKYLGDLKTKEREELAMKIKEDSNDITVSSTHLFMIGNGKRNPSRKLAAVLEKVTRGKVVTFDFDREVKEKVKNTTL